MFHRVAVTRGRRFCLLAGLLFLARVGGAHAFCLPTSDLAIELELLACRPADVAMAERIAGTDLWWLRPYLENVARGNPGVVLRGKVLRFRDVNQPATIFPWEEGGDKEEELFIATSDPNFCGTFEGLQTLALVKEEPCCDVIPPSSVACVLSVAEARSKHSDLDGRVESPVTSKTGPE